MRLLNVVQVARAVALAQEEWIFCRVAVNRYDETGQFTRRVGQGGGRMTTPQNNQYLTICALWCGSPTARELQQDLRRVSGVMVSDSAQTVRNRLRELSL